MPRVNPNEVHAQDAKINNDLYFGMPLSNAGSQAEQYPYGLNKAIHAVAVDAWSRDFNYEEYLRYAGVHDRAKGNTITNALTEVAYKAVCDEWEAKMEKDMAAAVEVSGIDPNDNMLLRHWFSNIVTAPQHLFNQRNHAE